ncbi:SMI1/KNR4 family protein [Streptomyces sp. BG9H]|uniref:SMI1/KNR4 family protein n=2 Tax=Streptomyces anatolicus TaxID=2675858 RepID=A0ABS6YSN7_9ACTN|nr:SMI1/KNR4 family protein [Streptomyces anatolicus]
MSVVGAILGGMEITARIAAFTDLVGPPPGAAPAVDWAAVEAWLEVPLPADYKALVSAYGPVEIGHGAAAVRLHTPCVSADGRYEYGAWVVETHRHSAIRPGMFTRERRRFLPEEGGLLALATTAGGDHLFWDTSVSKDPDAWPVVLLTTSIAVGAAEPWVSYEVPLLDVLSAAVRDSAPAGDGAAVRTWGPLAGAAPWTPPPRGAYVDARQHAALTEGEGLEAVTALIPPPLTPHLGTGSWEQVFARLGTRLPTDFMALAERYGAGNWSWWLDMPAPLDLEGRFGLAADAEEMLEGYRTLREAHPEYYPMPAWPEPGGFLPFASTIDGDMIGWCADGEPDEWRVAVNPRHCEQGPPLPGNFTGTLLNWLRGDGPATAGFPGLRADQDPLEYMFFEPFGPRGAG